MNYTIIAILLTLVSFNTMAKNTVSEKPFYGEEINAKSAVSYDTIVKDFPSFKGKDLVMEAVVEKVCASKGCWMTLKSTKSASSSFRVKFQDYKFFVPLSLAGKKVWVNGKISRKELSIKDTKHYLEDAGASKEEIAAVTKKSFEYHFMAKGVLPR